MSYNGIEVKPEEYTEDYPAAYADVSAEYQELIGLGLDEQVTKELCELFQNGECFALWYSFVRSRNLLFNRIKSVESDQLTSIKCITQAVDMMIDDCSITFEAFILPVMLYEVRMATSTASEVLIKNEC